MVTSGVVRYREVSLAFDTDDDARVLLLVHDTKPPFLEGKVVGTKVSMFGSSEWHDGTADAEQQHSVSAFFLNEDCF